ncbi:hypothetical protein V1477_001976, partial [Vespula maculifrons]
RNRKKARGGGEGEREREEGEGEGEGERGGGGGGAVGGGEEGRGRRIARVRFAARKKDGQDLGQREQCYREEDNEKLEKKIEKSLTFQSSTR